MQRIPTHRSLHQPDRRQHQKENQSQNDPARNERQRLGQLHPRLPRRYQKTWPNQCIRKEPQTNVCEDKCWCRELLTKVPPNTEEPEHRAHNETKLLLCSEGPLCHFFQNSSGDLAGGEGVHRSVLLLEFTRNPVVGGIQSLFQ